MKDLLEEEAAAAKAAEKVENKRTTEGIKKKAKYSLAKSFKRVPGTYSHSEAEKDDAGADDGDSDEDNWATWQLEREDIVFDEVCLHVFNASI